MEIFASKKKCEKCESKEKYWERDTHRSLCGTKSIKINRAKETTVECLVSGSSVSTSSMRISECDTRKWPKNRFLTTAIPSRSRRIIGRRLRGSGTIATGRRKQWSGRSDDRRQRLMRRELSPRLRFDPTCHSNAAKTIRKSECSWICHNLWWNERHSDPSARCTDKCHSLR